MLQESDGRLFFGTQDGTVYAVDARSGCTYWTFKAGATVTNLGRVDGLVAKSASVVIGSGIRGSKLWLPGSLLAELPSAEVLPGLGVEVGQAG